VQSTQPRLRDALACAWPSMVLGALLLLPFLNAPFTIDDPIYLREAQHLLEDPFHPQAFNMVWSTDLDLRASQILPGGVAAPYLLVPTALAGCAEWVGHLTQMSCLLAALFATALAALRFGLDQHQARLAALLTAACPAVLGMAGTVMPDVPAMLFVILGMERVIAWRDHRKWQQALLSTLWAGACCTHANSYDSGPGAGLHSPSRGHRPERDPRVISKVSRALSAGCADACRSMSLSPL